MKKKRWTAAMIAVILLFIQFSVFAAEDTTERTIPSEGSQNPARQEISLFIESSLRYVMEEIVQEFQKKYPQTTVYLYAESAGVLRAQLEQGADCDLIFLDSVDIMEELAEQHMIKKESIIQLLENKVVLIQPEHGTTEVTSFDTIIRASNLALANENNSIREYVTEILEYLNVWNSVKRVEVHETETVSAVLGSVREGCNEIGIVYATDAAFAADEVEVIAQAPDNALTKPVSYSAALTDFTTLSAETVAAKEFLEFLKTETAEMIFKSYGFLYLSQEE